jgi:serine/threonine protein kinase
MEDPTLSNLIEYAPDRVLEKILLHTEPEHLASFCSVQRKVASLCRSLDFRQKYNSKYPDYEFVALKSYDILKHLGKGAGGEVKEVERKGKKYAMKIINVENKDIKKIWAEIELMATLRHPHIIHYERAIGPRAGEIRLYMEICKTDLFTYGKWKMLTGKKVLNIICQIASAIKYIHQKGYIHRDIKGENIMKCGKSWKLIDFGLSQKIKEAEGLYGTLDFLAPEIIESEEIGPPVDVWALGITLYELLFGTVPFIDRTNKKTMKRIVNGPLTIPKVPEISKDLKEILEGMLTKDQYKRWTIDQVLEKC